MSNKPTKRTAREGKSFTRTKQTHIYTYEHPSIHHAGMQKTTSDVHCACMTINRQTGPMLRQTDGRTDRQTDRQTCCPTLIVHRHRRVQLRMQMRSHATVRAYTQTQTCTAICVKPQADRFIPDKNREAKATLHIPIQDQFFKLASQARLRPAEALNTRRK